MFNACAPITLSIRIAKFHQYRTRAISLNLLLAKIIHCIALTSMQPYTSRMDNYDLCVHYELCGHCLWQYCRSGNSHAMKLSYDN